MALRIRKDAKTTIHRNAKKTLHRNTKKPARGKKATRRKRPGKKAPGRGGLSRAVGKRATAEDRRAVRREAAEREERERQQVFQAIRKKEWREMSGRPDQVLNKQADLYGIPLRGDTVNLPAIARWIHDFLAEHAAVLQAHRNGNDLDTRRKAARLGLEELRLERERAELVPAREVENVHLDWARWTLGVFDAAIAGLPAKLAGKTVHQQRHIVRAFFRARVEDLEKRRPK